MSEYLDKMAQMPLNLVEVMPQDLLKKIISDLCQNYVFPQFMERQQFEPMWDELLNMYRLRTEKNKKTVEKVSITDNPEDDLNINVAGKETLRVSDSLIFDTVDRLKNLNHFISWKDGTPIKYSTSPFYNSAKEDEFYHPRARKEQGMNALLQWNIDGNAVYRKHPQVCQHHYLYGIAFVESELMLEAGTSADGQKLELKDFGVSFDPLSLRKLWLNWRLSAYDLDLQPCPVHFEPCPRFAILQNQYDQMYNPFGYGNLEEVQKASPQYLFSSTEVQSWMEAVRKNFGSAEVLKPEYSVEAKWKLHPMIPFDPETGEYEKRQDGSPVPMKRFIVELWGSSIISGNVLCIRFQESPYKRLPIYASAHLPDVDSGMYSMAIGEVLQHHYYEITTALQQWLDNKDLINDPPSWCVMGSPAATENRNKKGADIRVAGPNDIGWRDIPDSGPATVQMLMFLREQAQQSSKAVDAIVGKAMGGRTSATEAQNVFQTAMSGVTTEINLFNFDVMGGYANRVWEYAGRWIDNDLLTVITGQCLEPLSTEDLNVKISLKWDVGSTFIESIVKQQHIRYALENAMRSPALRQDILWREFFRELRLPELQKAVIDNGFAKAVQIATEEACSTYLGKGVIVSPMADHAVAIETKTRFLEDVTSVWNREYGNLPYEPGAMFGMQVTRSQFLQMQIQEHQKYQQQQMLMQMMAQQMNPSQPALPDVGNNANNQQPPNTNVPERPGQLNQGMA